MDLEGLAEPSLVSLEAAWLALLPAVPTALLRGLFKANQQRCCFLVSSPAERSRFWNLTQFYDRFKKTFSCWRLASWMSRNFWCWNPSDSGSSPPFVHQAKGLLTMLFKELLTERTRVLLRCRHVLFLRTCVSSCTRLTAFKAVLEPLLEDSRRKATPWKRQRVAVCLSFCVEHPQNDPPPPADGINIENFAKRDLAAFPICAILGLIYWTE